MLAKKKIKAEIINSHNNSSSYNNSISIVFLLFQLIVLGSILSTTNMDIFLSAKPFSKISINGFDVDVAFKVIYIIIPFILLLFHYFILFNFELHYTKFKNKVGSKFCHPFLLNIFLFKKDRGYNKKFFSILVYLLFFLMPLLLFLLILIKISKYQSNLIFIFHFLFFIIDFIIVVKHFNKLRKPFSFIGFLSKFHFVLLLLAVFHLVLYCFILSEILPTKFIQNRFYSNILPILIIENEIISGESPLEKLIADGSLLYSSGHLNLKNRNFKYAQFSNLSFNKIDFRKSDLSNSNLNNIECWDCILQFSVLNNIDCNNCAFLWSDLRNISMQNIKFKETINFSNSNIEGCNFGQIIFPNSNFTKTKASGTIFTGSKLNGANFKNADLSNSNFIASEVTWANFSCSNLKYANFTGAALDHSIFSGANLYRTKFYAVEFYKGDLSFTDLRYTLLQGAYLSDAKFEGSIFQDMKFKNIEKYCQKVYEKYNKSGYSFYNLRGSILNRSTGKILIIEGSDGECIFYPEKIFHYDSAKYFNYVDSVSVLLNTTIVSIDTAPGIKRPSLVENFAQRMKNAKYRYDTALVMKYYLPNTIKPLIGKQNLGKYIELLETNILDKHAAINCMIDNYTEFSNNNISLKIGNIDLN